MNKRTKKQNILLVEDEAPLRKGIRLNLEAEGFAVTDFSDAASALEGLADAPDFSLGILDIMMPGKIDGLELCKKIRERKLFFPVIFLTARTDIKDKLEAFRSGADDYITKPFDLEELLARVSARLRKKPLDTVTIGDFTLDMESGTAVSGGKTKRFNERELIILSLLVENRGRPVTRDQILDSAWSTAEFPTNRTVDNFIVKFRKIFEPDPANPRHFITRFGVGYELSAEE